MNVIMLRDPLVYCAVLFSFDFYLRGSSIYVYMSVKSFYGNIIDSLLDKSVRAPEEQSVSINTPNNAVARHFGPSLRK
jgi:hypothetical protein